MARQPIRKANKPHPDVNPDPRVVAPGAPRNVWAYTGTSIFDPYPCRCHERRYSRCSPKYCPCAGRTDLDGMPDGCCARNVTPDEATS